MAVALRGSSTPYTDSINGTTGAITLNGSILGGDLIFIDIYSAGTATVAAPTTPSGWTQLDTAVTSAGTFRRTTIYKLAAGTVGGSSTDAASTVTVTLNGSYACMMESDAYSGADQTTPIPQHGMTAAGSASTSHSTAAETTTVANSWIRESLADKGVAATYTLPSGFTARSGGLISLTGGAVAQMEVADTNGGVTIGAHGSDAWVSTLSTASAITAIQVIAPATGTAPTANAGPDQTTVEPFSTVTLDASASVSNDGGTLTYVWTHVSGPSSVGALSSSTAQKPTYTAPANAANQTDVWTCTVHDSVSGLTNADNVSITILAATSFYLNGSGTWVPMQIIAL